MRSCNWYYSEPQISEVSKPRQNSNWLGKYYSSVSAYKELRLVGTTSGQFETC